MNKVHDDSSAIAMQKIKLLEIFNFSKPTIQYTKNKTSDKLKKNVILQVSFMIIIWSGFGFLVPLIFCISSVIFANSQAQLIIGRPYNEIVVYLTCAVSYWFLGRYLHKDKLAATEKDEVEPHKEKKPHTFFFIKIEYWPIACFIYIAIILKKLYNL